MSKNTPWPWVADFRGERIVGADGNVVVHELNTNEDDARLIAAAPELLEALNALIPMFAEWHEEFPEHIGDKEYPALQQARAAIAKAEGETQ